jgi:murein DD-endopeptidase MepM/ murein hydrolase activator NlpD
MMDVNIGTQDSSKPHRVEYIYDNYQSNKKASLSPYHINGRGDNKWIIQLLVSIGILVFVLGLFKTDIPYTGALKNGIRYVLTSEIDISPIFYKAVQLVSRAESFDWTNLEDVPKDALPASSSFPPNTLLFLPVSGKVVRTYGWTVESDEQIQQFHEGVDIAAPVGTGAKASIDGVVTKTGVDNEEGSYLLYRNDSGQYIRYANLSEVLVKKGQQVKAGDTLAKTGMQGNSEPHLHFEIILNGKPVEPLDRLGINLNGTNNKDSAGI